MTDITIQKLAIALLLILIAFVGIQKLTPLISDRLEKAAMARR